MDIVADRGFDPLALLEGTAINPAVLNTPDFRFSAAEAARIVFNAYRITGDSALGLELGLRVRPTTHGYLGYAMMSCNNLGEALDVTLRYLHIRQRDFSVRRFEEDELTIVEFQSDGDTGPLRHFFLEGLTIGLVQTGLFLIGDKHFDGEVWYDWPEPEYFEPYRRRLSFLRFDKPSVRICFPSRYLSRPLPMADPTAASQAIAQCERELALTGPAPDNLIERVLNELCLSSDGYPDLPTVASCIFISERTLKRRLKRLGKSYQTLLDEVRYRDAQKLLQNPDLSIGQIGEVLGYKDPPSFSRAFKRWAGVSPSEVSR